MPIGKDSITKRVAKTTEEKNIAPELVATTAAPAKKAPAKKSTTTSTAKKTTSTTSAAKKTTTTAKKPAVKAESAKEVPAVEASVVETAVLTNVAPETVAAVIGHKEDEKYEKVQIGQKMPDFLL